MNDTVRAAIGDLNHECSHIHQWEELNNRAKRVDLMLAYDSEGFFMHPRIGESVKCPTLADLRAAISDWVAEERRSGRMKT